MFLILLIVLYKSSKGPSRNAWYKIVRVGLEGIVATLLNNRYNTTVSRSLLLPFGERRE
jgi:hypothetical protein